MEPGVERGADAPTRILDVRTAGEWVGTDLRARRGGHIPGARNRLFSDLLTDEGTFRPVDEMLSIIRVQRRRPGRDSRDVLPGRRPRGARVVRPPRARRLRRASAATPARGRNGATARTARSRRPKFPLRTGLSSNVAATDQWSRPDERAPVGGNEMTTASGTADQAQAMMAGVAEILGPRHW